MLCFSKLCRGIESNCPRGTPPKTYNGVLSDEAKIHVLEKEDPLKEEYGDVIFYLNSGEFPSDLDLQQKTRLQ
jgi:hypothetical protein